jgi:hypothetical protein
MLPDELGGIKLFDARRVRVAISPGSALFFGRSRRS